jgi:hypothetical protein
VHARGRNSQLALRWRLIGRPARHVTWQGIARRVDGLPPALAQWYRRAHAAALLLNHQEMAARHELRLAERCAVEDVAGGAKDGSRRRRMTAGGDTGCSHCEHRDR